MPEVRFRIRWPDGSHRVCYSPSTIIMDFVRPGQEFALADFVTVSKAGLDAASGRVAARYGRSCSRAAAEIEAIAHLASNQDPNGLVLVEAVE